MALMARLASVLLVSALTAGCNQSLFDADRGGDATGDGGNPPPDTTDGGDERDSGSDRPDARITDAGRVDMPDARIPGTCLDPCVGDAYADFDGTANGRNGLWRYVEVDSSYNSVAMSSTTYAGTAPGWIGTGTSPPGIAQCSVTSDQLPCGDLANTLVFITTPGGALTNPGLSWNAPTAGDYRLIVEWKFPSAAPLVSSLFYLVQGESGTREFSTDAQPGIYDVTLTLAESETVTLTAFPITSESTSLAVNFFITGPLGAQSTPTAVERDGSHPAGFQGVQP